MTLQEKIGQKLMGGFPGTSMSGDFIRLVKEYKISNVILFRRNVESRAQVKKLCADIRTLVRDETGHGALIAIDQEGGGVTRLTQDCINVPGAMALAATDDVNNAYISAGITARELRALGVNFNLAPVADVNVNPRNPVIGARSFADDPNVVAEYAVSAMHGYCDAGILACAKHFPGHGDTAADSHIALPMVDKSKEALERTEFVPFRAMVAANCPAIMTSHILFPQIEPDRVPATMSRKILTGILKDEMHFRGLVASDCMEMDAIARFYGTAQGAWQAVRAGVDLVIVCHSAKRLEEAAAEIRRRIEDGVISMDEIDASCEKILAYKEKYCLDAQENPSYAQDRARAQALRIQSIALAKGNLPALGDHPFFAGCADYRAALVNNSELNAKTFAGTMASALGGTCMVTDQDPDDQAIAEAAARAQGATSIIVNTYNGHLFPGQIKLVRALADLNIPTAVVALGSPYDLQKIPDTAAGLAAWDYSQDTLDALAEILSGRMSPTGKMPVAL